MVKVPAFGSKGKDYFFLGKKKGNVFQNMEKDERHEKDENLRHLPYLRHQRVA